ncbi:MAG TPA: amidophosphoribosyltransferase, partial [Alphaproteobacteria bacterium]|nr:amidophosphoribosyltransferase [Alphaproteobacteria bacterium]
DDNIAKAILDFKFHDKPQLAKTLGVLLTNKAKELGISENSLLVPVPVHSKRLLTRKYNQASLLAKYLAKEIDLKYSNNALKRVKHTPHQTGQSAKVRKKQLAKAFNADKTLIENKDIILIDDVFTTGSTVNLCAQELKEKGAKSVKVLTIAYTAL